MPLYRYACETCRGVTDQLFDADEDKPRFIDCDCGAKAERVLGAQVAASLGRESWSEALAVHPSQIAAQRQKDAEHGVPVPYDRWGRPGFTSRGQKKRYCQAYGYFNRDAGYGDASPR